MNSKLLLGVILALLLPVIPLSAQPTVGSEAPNFTIVTYNGEVISLKDLQGKYVVLVFFCYYCPYCQEDLPLMAQVLKTCAPSDLEVILDGISGNAALDEQFFLSLNESTWKFVPENTTLSSEYHVVSVPTTVIIDPSGKVTYVYVGVIDQTSFCQAFNSSQSQPRSQSQATTNQTIESSNNSSVYAETETNVTFQRTTVETVVVHLPIPHYTVVQSQVDEAAAEELSKWLPTELMSSKPNTGSYIVVGGPFANTAARRITEKAGIRFLRCNGSIEMKLPVGGTYEVSGKDWGLMDYAVVFSVVDVDRTALGIMGCTRYGTKAAVEWYLHHNTKVVKGFLYLLLWTDLNGDRKVQLNEIKLLKYFPLPPRPG